MKTTTPLVNAPLMAVVKDYPTTVEGQDSGGGGGRGARVFRYLSSITRTCKIVQHGTMNRKSSLNCKFIQFGFS